MLKFIIIHFKIDYYQFLYFLNIIVLIKHSYHIIIFKYIFIIS